MRYPTILLAVLILLGTVLAFDVHDRTVWAIENAMALAALTVLVASAPRLPLSKVSYSLLFGFFALHAVGAHFTYARVPYDDWSEALFGWSISAHFGFERNHYDRVIHFAYGLLFAYPYRDDFLRVAGVKGFWGYFLPLDFVMSTSLVDELVEWGAAFWLGENATQDYLGAQGDIWDAHWDMAMAIIGATLALVITSIAHASLDRDFLRDWNESLSVKDERPLGEAVLRRRDP